MLETLYRALNEGESTERLGEMEEVSGLPDSISREGSSSQAVDRVRKKQREKHERAREEFRDRLSGLSSEYEKKIAEASQGLKEHMDGITSQIEMLTQPLTDKETVVPQSYSQLESVWDQTVALSALHQSSIDTFRDTLSEMERKKSSALNVVFSQFSERFTRVGYLTPPQCVSLLEEEAWKMNYTLIENQRSCNQLLFRLRSSYIVHEKKCRDSWLSLVEFWRELKVEGAVEEFSTFMSDPSVESPPQFRRILEDLSEEQRLLNEERTKLIFNQSNLHPPVVCKRSILEWERKVRKIQERIESLNTRYVVLLNDSLSRVHEYCLEEATAFKSRLVFEKVCEEDDVFQVMNDRLLPPVEDLHAITEEMVHCIEQSLDSHLSMQRSQLDDITDFIGEGSFLWQQHQDGLNSQERVVQEQLDSKRAEHNTKNHYLESNVDLWLDKLRQAPNKPELQLHFNQAKKYLRIISEGYTEFHQHMENIIEDYPQQISSLLSLYEESLMKGMSIGKAPPKMLRKKDSLLLGGRITRASSQSLSSAKQACVRSEPLTTDGGNTLYWLIRSDMNVENSEPVCFITQATSKHSMLLDLAVENVKFPDNLLFTFKKNLILCYLNHLEVWKREGGERAGRVVGAKNEELTSELELRLHLHEPRENNINLDIRTARENELKEHETSFEEHTQVIDTALEKQRDVLANELTPTIEKMTADFREKLKEIESHKSGMSRHTQLQAVVEVAEAAKSAHVRTLKNLMKNFRVSIDDTLYTVKEANVIFRKNLKTFSEGKNFSPEEIETFSRGLDSILKNIDVYETSIKADIDSLQSHHYQVALDTFGKLSDRFEHNLIDINFMEKVNAKFKEIQLQIRIETAASNSQAEEIQQHVQLLAQLVESLQQKFENMCVPDYELIRCAVDELYKKTQTRIDYLYCYSSISEKGSTLVKFQKITSDVISAMSVTRSILQGPPKRDSMTPSTDPSATPSLAVIDVERVPSSTNRSRAASNSPSASLAGEKSYMNQRRRGLSRYQLLKHPGFGTEGGNDANNNASLLPKIRKLLYSKNDELFQMSDSFYKSRSSKSILHIDSLPETSEMCMLNVNKRLHSYRTQLEEYRLACIEELRGQTEKLHTMLVGMPLVIFTGILYQITFVLHSEKKILLDSFSQQLSEFEKIRDANCAQLRPNLGHIANRDILDKLCQSEEERHMSAVESIAKCHTSTMEQLILSGESFTSQLQERVTFMCDLFQNITQPNDIIKIPEKDPSSAQSSMKHPEPTQDSRPARVDPLPKLFIEIPKEWYKLSSQEIEELTQTPALNIPITSDLASSLFECRDSIFLAFTKDYVSELRRNSEYNETLITRESSYFDNWNESVSDIKSLFI